MALPHWQTMYTRASLLSQTAHSCAPSQSAEARRCHQWFDPWLRKNHSFPRYALLLPPLPLLLPHSFSSSSSPLGSLKSYNKKWAWRNENNFNPKSVVHLIQAKRILSHISLTRWRRPHEPLLVSFIVKCSILSNFLSFARRKEVATLLLQTMPCSSELVCIKTSPCLCESQMLFIYCWLH